MASAKYNTRNPAVKRIMQVCVALLCLYCFNDSAVQILKSGSRSCFLKL